MAAKKMTPANRDKRADLFNEMRALTGDDEAFAKYLVASAEDVMTDVVHDDGANGVRRWKKWFRWTFRYLIDREDEVVR